MYTPATGAFNVALAARFVSGAVGTLEINDAQSWDHPSESVTLTGTGAAIAVENVDHCMYRAAGNPELRWRPNYTVPAGRFTSAAVAGFLGALEHFEAVARGETACESDIGSARRTMELAEQVQSKAEASPRLY